MVTRTVRVGETPGSNPGSLTIQWARRIVAIHGIRIAETRFRLPPSPHDK